jgi:hypothetical protein
VYDSCRRKTATGGHRVSDQSRHHGRLPFFEASLLLITVPTFAEELLAYDIVN